MNLFFSKKKEDEIKLPSSQYIYELLFSETLKKIKKLELDKNQALINKTKFDEKNFKENTQKNIDYLGILFGQKETKKYINYEMPVDKKGEPIGPKESNTGTKLNQFIIFINYIEMYWIVCGIVEKWIEAGGNLSNVSKKDLDKYEMIKFLKELYEGFSNIKEKTIDDKIDMFFHLLDSNQKKRYYSYKTYLLLKKKDINDVDLLKLKKFYDLGMNLTLLDEMKQTKLFMYLEKYYTNKIEITPSDFFEYEKILNDSYNKSTNKCDKITEYYKRLYLSELDKLLENNDLVQLKKKYDYGIDFNLLDKHKIKKIFIYLEKYYVDKNTDAITKKDFIEYEKIINDINNNKNKTEKIKTNKIIEYYKRLCISELNKLLVNPDLNKYNTEIFSLIHKLEKMDYVLTPEQNDKLSIFKMPLLTLENTFKKENWFPLFSDDELDCLKNEIKTNENNICDIIKKIFPFYKISYDFFCTNTNRNTNEKLYDNQEDINKTTNAFCIIILLIGIINYKLWYTKQDYEIIIKGGKGLQLLMSKIQSQDNQSNYKSNDIDLIINPKKGIEYNEFKCKILSDYFVNLVKWILNENDNNYVPENKIVSQQGWEYKNLLKISYKIHKTERDYYDAGHTAIADIDFGEKNNSMYKNLVYDFKKSITYGKLLYIYQSYDDYLFEKIYYLDFYLNKLINIDESKIPKTGYSKELKEYNNYKRLIEKFLNQILQVIKIELGENPTSDEILSYLKDYINKKKMSVNIWGISRLIIKNEI